MVAPQQDANCHEDVVLEIQNITDLNQFALANENTLQIETEESERSARKGRPVVFFITVSLFLHLCIHVNSVHIHIFVTYFS